MAGVTLAGIVTTSAPVLRPETTLSAISWRLIGQIEAGASQRLHRAAIEARRHAVAIAYPMPAANRVGGAVLQAGDKAEDVPTESRRAIR
jgi:hypothetical protein